MEQIAMSDTLSLGARLDHDLIVLLDHALTMAADRLTSEQRADLWTRTEAMGLVRHVEHLCSPEVQRVLLGERPRVNPDGGQVGDAVSEPPHREDGATLAEGSARMSGTPTA